MHKLNQSYLASGLVKEVLAYDVVRLEIDMAQTQIALVE